MFCLDTPSGSVIGRLSRFSGWYLDEGGVKPVGLSLYVDETQYARLCYGSRRDDVAAVYPQRSDARFCGFYGDLLLEKLPAGGDEIVVRICAHYPRCTDITLYRQKYRISEHPPLFQKRDTSFALKELLGCPGCRELIDLGRSFAVCQRCGSRIHLRYGVPHFLSQTEIPLVRCTENQFTHPYSSYVRHLIDGARDGIVLDFGAGNTPRAEVLPKICYLDVQQYENTDIVSTSARLPFAAEIFDVVISQSVFEHLPDPFQTAQELYRILKPGGYLYADTAFMQPLHADPGHFFNMTIHGLRRVFASFEELDCGVGPHQLPSFGLRMQIEAILPFVQQKEWVGRLERIKRELDDRGPEFDAVLREDGRFILAAGVYFYGQKALR